jgi:colanic acid/amylovoran biosynthesis protein
MSQDTCRIFVINATDWFNKGDVLNRIGAICALRKAMGMNLEISIESATSENDTSYFSRFSAKIIESVYSYRSGDKLLKLVPRFMFSSVILVYYAIFFKLFGAKQYRSSKEAEYFNTLVDSDLILSSPGGFIHDELPLTVFLPSLFQIAVPVLLRKHVIIFAQSIGPLTRKLSKVAVRIVLSRINCIILREDISRSLLKDIELHAQTYVTTDAAFSISSEMISEANEEAKSLKNRQHKPMIGITVLNQYWASGNIRNNYTNTMSALVDWLVERFEARVFFVPWRLSSSDVELTKAIYANVKHKASVTLDFHDHTPEDLLRLIGSLDILVGTRMHSCIAAALMDVPFVNIVYQFKSKGIMRALGMEEYTIAIDMISIQKLSELVEKLWLNSSSVRSHLVERVEYLREKSEKSGRIVQECLAY